MLWRMRATLPDRPGTLAELARKCGKAGVNIVGVQMFRGGEAATVELVVEAPDTVEADLVELVHRGGARILRACNSWDLRTPDLDEGGARPPQVRLRP